MSPPASAARDEGRVVGREVEDALDDGTVGAGAHERAVGPAAEEQPERGDDHRLAGAGLAGEHREPAVERQHGLVDDPEVADADLLDHGAASPLDLLPPGRTAPALAPGGRTSRRAGR